MNIKAKRLRGYWINFLYHKGYKKKDVIKMRELAKYVHKELYQVEKTFTKKEGRRFLSSEMKRRVTDKTKLYGETQEGCVYFIGNEDHDWVKIGKTTNLPNRLSQLQTSCPFDLSILGYVKSQYPDRTETKLHYKFQDDRIRGEWFQLSSDIKDFITEIYHI